MGYRVDDITALSDTELVTRYQEGCQDALHTLIKRYRRFARSKALGYFIVGADRDDVEQEALIGLYKAVRDFRPDLGTQFRGFAELCIKRQIITAITSSSRQKNQALNQYVSISGSADGDDSNDVNVDELIYPYCHGSDPADRIVTDERLAAMHNHMRCVLSPFEADVLSLYVKNNEYQEISDCLGCSVKSIDNAIQRIKRKVEAYIVERDDVA